MRHEPTATLAGPPGAARRRGQAVRAESASAGITTAAQPRAQAIWGGLLAGMAIAIALAIVMHVIQQAVSDDFRFSISRSVFFVLFLGLIIGSGLGMGLAAVVPDSTADSPESHHAKRTDQ